MLYTRLVYILKRIHVMINKEIDRIIKANIKMAGFISLVKRMREAQKNFNNIRFIDKSSESYKDAKKSRKQLESEVDEYLMKIND